MSRARSSIDANGPAAKLALADSTPATAAEWVARLAEAHHAGRIQAELTRLGRYPLLVVDEVGYIPFESEAANLFFRCPPATNAPASSSHPTKPSDGGAKCSATTSWPPP